MKKNVWFSILAVVVLRLPLWRPKPLLSLWLPKPRPSLWRPKRRPRPMCLRP
jgi:hypothetical protein